MIMIGNMAKVIRVKLFVCENRLFGAYYVMLIHIPDTNWKPGSQKPKSTPS